VFFALFTWLSARTVIRADRVKIIAVVSNSGIGLELEFVVDVERAVEFEMDVDVDVDVEGASTFDVPWTRIELIGPTLM
jgi:hypothetical protein